MPIQVRVVPFDSRWAEMYAAEARRVAAALGVNAVAVHHIGSTSIPGIFAKPIIDILVAVADIELVDAHRVAMEALGYEVMGEFGIPGRRYFRKDDAAGIRTHHVHSFAVHSGEIDRHPAFRDFLRAHSEFAQQYSELKRRLAAAHPDSIERYMDGKDAFIREVQRRGLEWRKSGGGR